MLPITACLGLISQDDLPAKVVSVAKGDLSGKSDIPDFFNERLPEAFFKIVFLRGH